MTVVLQVILLVIAAWAIGTTLWALFYLLRSNVYRSLSQPQNHAPKGIRSEKHEETEHYLRVSKVEDGIEWVSYIPKQKRHQTPILMQHGMWHGAWCWQQWQEYLAEQGWESHAISLPGHGASPLQRPIRQCTLDYYLAFVRDAVDKMPVKPVLMGHSMGGALTQWYLRYVGNLPAAVLVAPWALVGGYMDSANAFMRIDPIGCVLTALQRRAEFVRNPKAAAAALTSAGNLYTPEQLYERLGQESVLVMLQHALPWKVPKNLNTPMLYLGGEIDAVIPEKAGRRAAAAYHADYVMVKKAAHNLMAEHNYRETVESIDNWLVKQAIA